MNKSAIFKCLSCCAVAASFILNACGDDNVSSSPDTEIVSSSSVDQVSSDSQNPVSSNSQEPVVSDLSSSSSVIADPVHENAGIAVTGFAAARTLNVTADTNGFFEAAEVYKAAPSDYKLVFVLRHSERLSGLGAESPLTIGGAEQAEKMGASFGAGEKFFYASTNFIRTKETCLHFAKGHGDENVEVETWEKLNGSYFLTVTSDSLDAFASKKGGGWKIISVYAFGENYYAEQVAQHFYPLKERGDQFVMENILPNVPSEYRVSIMVSHDVLMEPLAVYASDGNVDINYYADKKWINYLSGVAIVVNSSSEVELYPVRGYDVGYMTLLSRSESAAKDSTAAPLLGTY